MDRLEEYKGIDVFRLIMSILVIVIHTGPLRDYNRAANYLLVNILARVAVPFFFFATGFFLYKKCMKNGIGSVTSYLLKILKEYIFWSIIYYPIYIAKYSAISNYTIGHLSKIYLRDFCIFGPYCHLWYLHAVLLGTTIIFILLKIKVKPINIVIISVPFYTLGLSYQSYYGLLSKFFGGNWILKQIFWNDTTCNGLYFGFIFIALGMLFAERECIYKNNENKGYGICLLVSIIFLIAEGIICKELKWTRKYDVEMYIGLLPVTWFLFEWLLCNPIKISGSISIVCRYLSKSVFYIHMIYVYIYTDLLKLHNSFVKFVFALVASVLTALILNWGKIRNIKLKQEKSI